MSLSKADLEGAFLMPAAVAVGNDVQLLVSLALNVNVPSVKSPAHAHTRQAGLNNAQS